MSKKHYSLIAMTFLILSIVGWSWLLLTIGPNTIVAQLGAENGYLIMFLIALFGGVSSFTGVGYVATIITLAGGGLSPLGLALASGAGISIGDTVYYLVGRHGVRNLVHGRLKTGIENLTRWLAARPRPWLWISVYVYTAFTPLPNDVLTITLGAAKQPPALVLSALVLGNMTLTYLIASFGAVLPW